MATDKRNRIQVVQEMIAVPRLTNFVRLFVGLSVAVTLSGCGGGGGSDSDYVEFDRVDGIWRETNYGGIVIISDDGSSVDVFDVLSGHFRGSLRSVDGVIYESSLTHFYPTILLDILNVTEGTVVPKVRIDATYEGPNTIPITLNMVYDPLSERASRLSLISGIWSRTEGESTTTITIDKSGMLFGSDSDGCVYAGTVTIPNANLNTYRIHMDIKSCEKYLVDGSGQGILMDTSITNDTLLFAVTRRKLPSGVNYIEKELFRQ